jgi:hypothetical protein
MGRKKRMRRWIMVMIVISSALGNTAGVALMVFMRALRGVWASCYMRVMYRRGSRRLL